MGICRSKQEPNFSDKTYQNTPQFSLQDQLHTVRVVDIYDGDTITVIIYLNKVYYRYTVRLEGIDTCEMKSKDNTTKNLALQARKRLFELISKEKVIIEPTISRKELREILNKNVYLIRLKCGEFEKFGRLLGTIYSETSSRISFEKSFNNILLKEKFAYSYEGKTKLTEEEQVELLV